MKKKNSLILVILTFIMIYLLPGCGLKLVPRYPEDSESAMITPRAVDDLEDATVSQTVIPDVRMDNTIRSNFVSEIKRFMGAPYKLGGSTPVGTDCSGLISAMYQKAAHITLPHSTAELAKSGIRVMVKDLSFGDLVFFNDGQGKKPVHVGFYIAKGQFIHASVSQGVVLSKITAAPFRAQYLGARRILQ